MIDVIIPVYRGLAQTRRCLESVLGAPVRARHEVVVVDDASPEPALSAWLRDLAGQGRIALLAHGRNAGFVASVNEGMRLHADRDVVLLNSDTEVAGDWLDRLAACAAREPKTGTVTPFSNNASIASYPRFARPNALPRGATTASLDALFARVNEARSVDLPTAVGFCMFISRRCLEDTGLFDEQAFGRGYGEEVDFCMKAARSGWRHLLAADTFVFHEGEVSFGGDAPAIRETAQRVIDTRYEEFRPRVAAFLARDPSRPLRRAVDLERLRLDSRPRVLLVSREGPEEGANHPSGQHSESDGEAQALSLRVAGDGRLRLSWLHPDEEFEAFFDCTGDWAPLVELLASIGIGRVSFEAPPEHSSRTGADRLPSPPERVFSGARDISPPPAGTKGFEEANATFRSRVLELERDLRQARARSSAIESSTFWRLTAPFRFLAHRLKLLVRGPRRRD